MSPLALQPSDLAPFLALAGVGLLVGAALGWRRWRRQAEESFTAYSSAGDWEEALPHAQRLAERWAPGHTQGRRQLNLGTVLARLGRWDEAHAALETALATQERGRDPLAGLTRVTLALLDLRRGDTAAALRHAKALEASPELAARARPLEAAAALVAGEPARARDLLLPGLEAAQASRKPGDHLALAVLAVALERTGERERARALAAGLRERMPEAQRRDLAGQLPLLASVLEG